MPAFKKLNGRILFVDLTEIHVPSWKIREVQKMAHAKSRELKKTNPFARCCGRKLKYPTPESLRIACEKYFDEQKFVLRDKWGSPLRDPETGEKLMGTHPLTLSGLARSIGLETVHLRRYKMLAEQGSLHPDYLEVIRVAMQRIEEYAERRIYDRDGSSGAQFTLQRSFGWLSRKDEIEIKRAKAELKISEKKAKMAEEEHRLKMEMLRAGLDSGEDNEINITITRAKDD